MRNEPRKGTVQQFNPLRQKVDEKGNQPKLKLLAPNEYYPTQLNAAH
jgi:hypothetical protein